MIKYIFGKPSNAQEDHCFHDDYHVILVAHHSKNYCLIFVSIPFLKLHTNFDSVGWNLSHPFFLDHDLMVNSIRFQLNLFSIDHNRDSQSKLQWFSKVKVPSKGNSLFLLDTRNHIAMMISIRFEVKSWKIPFRCCFDEYILQNDLWDFVSK